MGFNISGLAINRNYENEFDQLQKELGWNLEKQSEIDFETASSNWTEDEVCNVYFTKNGTLIFIGMDMYTDSFPLKSDNTLTFALSETSMAFNINYCENGVEKRSIMEVNDERMTDEGEKLEIEEKSEDTSEIIWNQIEKVIGKRFWDIEPDEKAVRYVFTKNVGIKENESKIYCIDKPISKEDLSTEFSDDELFKYFDQIIEFAQKNQINAFLIPWAHKDNGRKFMNLFAIITEISNRNNLSNTITKRMPLDRFKMLCRFDPEKIDSKTKSQMLKELNMIGSKTTNYSSEETLNSSEEKKWWQFWK
ncbi:hypothetical protein H7F37_01220 [Winogradskyella sp. PAMC22761]|nr:hypothetical protein H7F37_01220 [Winogradskyella sp. PAMC22761]